MRISSGPASRCARNPGSRARQGDSDPKAGRREARTSGRTTEVRAGAESSARLSVRPLYKKWKVHLSVSFDKKSATASDHPFLGLAPPVEMMRALRKRPTWYERVPVALSNVLSF